MLGERASDKKYSAALRKELYAAEGRRVNHMSLGSGVEAALMLHKEALQARSTAKK